MGFDRLLLNFGIVLLAVAALLGFVQHRHRDDPRAFALWRVVHTGGTAGAVQLIALAAVWHHIAQEGVVRSLISWGVIFATWAFFLGPLANALGRHRTASTINKVGALVALPSYVLLPFLLLW